MYSIASFSMWYDEQAEKESQKSRHMPFEVQILILILFSNFHITLQTVP